MVTGQLAGKSSFKAKGDILGFCFPSYAGPDVREGGGGGMSGGLYRTEPPKLYCPIVLIMILRALRTRQISYKGIVFPNVSGGGPSGPFVVDYSKYGIFSALKWGASCY